MSVQACILCIWNSQCVKTKEMLIPTAVCCRTWYQDKQRKLGVMAARWSELRTWLYMVVTLICYLRI